MNPSRQGRRSLKRVARLLFLLVWLTLVLTPCLAFVLAARNELRIRTGPAPEQELRLWLVQDSRRAGLALSRAHEQEVGGQRCFLTDVSFLLWRGQHLDQETATSFCSCYAAEDLDFRLPATRAGACVIPAAPDDD